MHRSMLAASAVPAAVAGDVIAASVMAELANAGHLTVQFTFVRGSGGTTATYWLQTSLDGGASWIDIACVQFTTASGKQIVNIDAGGYVAPGYVPGDGTLAAGSVVDGILGDRLRIKQTIVGTYADSTIAVDVVDKAGVGAQKRAPGQAAAAASTPVVATGPITASPSANDIAQDAAATVVAATYAAGSAPTGATNGYRVNLRGYGGRVRALFDYTGSVTACNVRLYTREPGGTAWYRGVSTDESGYPLTPALGDESRDWDIGEGVEFLFVVESISPGTSGNTVAIKAAGVAR